MRHRISKLGELYRTCSTHLFQNLDRAGISHWWADKPDSPKGAAVFFYYDAEATCLRTLPNTPKYFEAALRSGLISNADATRLSCKLIRTISTILDEYSGFFADELNTGEVGRIIKHAAELNDFSLLEAHRNMAPDDIYAAMPWPLIPALHFNFGKFMPAGIRSNYIVDAGQDPMRAVNIAVDVVTFTPSFDVDTETIETVLDWLKGRHSRHGIAGLLNKQTSNLQKIAIPSFVGGFQGVAFGLFSELPVELEPFVINQLHQFSETVGEHVAYSREQDYLFSLEKASNLIEYASAFMKFLPPVEHAVFRLKAEKVGFRLNQEGEYLTGYQPIYGDELESAFSAPENESLSIGGIETDLQIRVCMSAPTDGLSPIFTLARIQPRLLLLPYLSIDETKPLGRTELGAYYHGLRRQIKEGRGAIAASKKLFLIDLVIQNFDEGEVTLSNSKARDFTERALGKPIAGYHVAGKAAKKFQADIQKMAPDVFLFEAMSHHALRVRWRPKVEHADVPIASELFNA